MVRILPAFLLLFLPTLGCAQTLESIDSIEEAAQKELDSGLNMLRPTARLYTQMDSLLNLAYYNLRTLLAKKERETLRKQQLTWLKGRDAYFKKLYKDMEEEIGLDRSRWGEVEYLSIYIRMNEYVKDRVRRLILMRDKKNA